MTLRVELKIIPFGVESDEYSIGKIDISNQGVVEQLPFGNIICRYNGVYSEMTLGKLEEIKTVEVTHNRKRGAVELVKLVCEKLDL